ncbi:MAG: hypothetical protein AAB789_00025, partial [Patescibacteria group bacterium]
MPISQNQAVGGNYKTATAPHLLQFGHFLAGLGKLKILAEKAGIELKKISPAEQRQFGVLYDINDSAKEFFKKKLEQSAESLK